MKKRLSTVGNGLALFIDKPLQKLLGLTAESIVNLETDGIRLTIEACGQREKQQHVTRVIEPWQRIQHVQWCGAQKDEDARVAYFARATFARLEKLGITDEVLRRIYRGLEFSFRRCWDCVPVYRDQVGSYSPFTSDSEFRSMHRLEALLEAKEEGLTWDEAVDEALHEVPFNESERSRDLRPLSPRPDTVEQDHNTLFPSD